MDRETLSRYKSRKKEIDQLEEQIAALNSKLTAPGIAKYSGMPRGAGGVSDPTGDGVGALDALCRRYMRKLKELCDQQQEVEDAIGTLNDEELRTIMRYRYISGYKWETICNLMGSEEYGPMDWMTVHRRHRKALEILEGKPCTDMGQ